MYVSQSVSLTLRSSLSRTLTKKQQMKFLGLTGHHRTPCGAYTKQLDLIMQSQLRSLRLACFYNSCSVFANLFSFLFSSATSESLRPRRCTTWLQRIRSIWQKQVQTTLIYCVLSQTCANSTTPYPLPPNPNRKNTLQSMCWSTSTSLSFEPARVREPC